MKRYIRSNSGKIFLLIALSVLDAVAIAGIPFITKKFIDYIPQINLRVILIFSALYIGDVLLILLFEYLVKIFSAKLYRDILSEMRDDLFKKIFSKPYRNFYKFDTDYYENIFINDLNLLYSDYFDCLFSLILSVISFAVYAIFALFINWIVALVIIISSFVTLLLPNLVGKKLSQKRKIQSDETKNYMSALKDMLQCYTLNNKFTNKKFIGVHNFYNRKKESSRYNFQKYQSFVEIFGGAMLYVINIATFVVGILLINFNLLTLSAFVAMLSYVELIVIPSRDVSYQIMGIKVSKEIRQKIVDILNEKYEEKRFAKHVFASDITLKDVSFSYGETAVFKGISLSFKKGKRYAIVGKSGSGKTTLANLILGRLDNFSGKITFDEVDISKIDPSAICAEINQKNFIFNASASDNITLFGALEPNGLDEMVQKLNAENIMRDNLGEFGAKLSGGEKRKIEILRCVMRKVPVLVGDEIFAGIDEKTEKDIKSFLSEQLKGATYIEITHDLSEENLRGFDEVIVLKDCAARVFNGKTVSRGEVLENM